MTFIVRLAEKNIKVSSVFPDFQNFCKDYIVEDSSCDFSISWTMDEILEEQAHCTEQNFSLPYLETLAALRKISDEMPKHHRLLLHGASIAYHNNAYLFTAPSGTGKSTHIRLWRKYLGEDVKIVNGDKPFVSLDGEPRIYGTPWAGKENWQKNHFAPLKGICFVTRGLTNTIRTLSPGEALPLIMKQVYIPTAPETVGLTLELLDTLLSQIPLYLLECDMSEDAVRCSFEALTKLDYPF